MIRDEIADRIPYCTDTEYWIILITVCRMHIIACNDTTLTPVGCHQPEITIPPRIRSHTLTRVDKVEVHERGVDALQQRL